MAIYDGVQPGLQILAEFQCWGFCARLYQSSTRLPIHCRGESHARFATVMHVWQAGFRYQHLVPKAEVASKGNDFVVCGSVTSDMAITASYSHKVSRVP